MLFQFHFNPFRRAYQVRAVILYRSRKNLAVVESRLSVSLPSHVHAIVGTFFFIGKLANEVHLRPNRRLLGSSMLEY